MNWLETYQNISNLIVCGGVSATLYAYYYINESYLNYAIPLIVAHFSSDLFLTKKPDLLLHHIFGLVIIAYKYLTPVQVPDDTSTILVMYKTEISTIFYVFKLFLPNMKHKIKWLIQINDVLFFITFFKFRIYDFYNILISNESTYIGYEKYDYSYLLLFAIHGMYILNVYWFLIICKIGLKPIIKFFSKQFSEYFCHFITTYTMFINLLVGSCCYILQLHNRNLYDIFGLSILSIASYNYHKYAYKTIDTNKELVYTSDDTITLFLQDIGSIHIRSFFAILTNYHFCNIVTFSCVFHASFYLMNILHIYYLKITKKQIVSSDVIKYNLFTCIQYLCLMIPCGYDIIMICLNSRGSIYSIHGFYISIFMGLLFIINPLYDMTHIIFHICLILHSICCSYCNMYTIRRDEYI